MSIPIGQANKLIEVFSARIIDINEANHSTRQLFKSTYRYTTTNNEVTHLSLVVEYDNTAFGHGYTNKIVNLEGDQLKLPPDMAGHIAEHLVLALLKLKI